MGTKTSALFPNLAIFKYYFAFIVITTAHDMYKHIAASVCVCVIEYASSIFSHTSHAYIIENNRSSERLLTFAGAP